MYNITLGDYHPSTICVVIDDLIASLKDLKEVIESPIPRESMTEFIESYARTDEIMPTDRTLGFVIVNKEKGVVSLSFSELSDGLRKEIEEIANEYRQNGFEVDADLQ